MAEEKLIRNPKLIIGEAEKVETEVVGADDIVVVTDEEFYTSKQIDELLKKSGGANLPILTNIWSDHLLNDVSWLRADTFSWQSGDVYVAAYEHLLNDYDSSDFEEAVWGYNEGGHIDVYTKTGNPQIGTTVYDTDIGEEVGTVSALGDDYIDVAVYGGARRFYRARNFDKMSHSDTIGDITIRYALGADGHKICLPDQESNISALYEATGAADYYLLDTANKQFKLPRKHKRKLIQSYKNGTEWYNLYSDGWVEQGGSDFAARTINAGTGTTWYVTMPVPMSDTNYNIQISFDNGNLIPAVNNNKQTTTTQVYLGCKNQHTASVTSQVQYWQVSGYAAESAYASAGMNLEYYYVGNFEQDSVEQTAGINAEMFNGKADRNLMNTTDNVDIVIESQLPTADNGYTWYRKYKSGWVEQGGVLQQVGTSANVTITFPVEMANNQYSWNIGIGYNGANQVTYIQAGAWNFTTTTMTMESYAQGKKSWQVSGMSAQ